MTSAKERVDLLRGYTPEAAAAAADEAEAWGAVLAGGGQAMLVPARTTHTSFFFVKQGAILT